MKKLNKVLSVLLALSFVVLCFAGCSKTADNKLEYKIDEEKNEVTITGYTDSTLRTDIVIPDDIDGIPVTKIADFGLFSAESLKTITIGKNVKEIGTWAMTDNQHLQEFIVADGNEYFTTVDGVLFTKDMKELIYYPNGKGVEFDKYANPVHRDKPGDEPKKDDYEDTDKYNEDLKKYQDKVKDFVEVTYEIPEGVEIIRSKAFYKCYYLDKVTMPDSVKTIEEKAFHRCSSLDTINLSTSLEYIGKDGFAYCEGLKTIKVPASIKEIGEYAFFDCKNVTELVIEAKESDVTLGGEKWMPSEKGKVKDECKITFAE